MGRKSNLKHETYTKANQKGGSYLTKEARKTTSNQFIDFLFENGYQVSNLRQIVPKHIIAFVEEMLHKGRNKRTLCNKMSVIRNALRANGMASLADSPEVSNKSLGISGGSRIGTRKPIPNDVFEKVIHQLELKDAGVAAVARLQRALGLRQMEALRGANSETLNQWKSQIFEKIVHVKRGTKGGRARVTILHNLNQAFDAVEKAIAIAEKNKGYCVNSKNLKEATYYLNNFYRSCGLQGEYSSHSLRYAWSQDQFQQYLDDGLTVAEARKNISHDLGHGDGRGRYVASVYLRK